MTEAEDHIDKSQWLPPKTRLVSSFRLQHGDLKPVQDPDTNIIIAARSNNKTIIQKLIEDGYLDEHHETDCMVFMDLHRAYLASIKIKWGNNLTSSVSGLTAGEANTLYDAIRHQLGIPGWETTIRIVVEASMEHPVQNMRSEIANVYRKEVEKLVNAMIEVKRKKVLA